MPFKDRNFEAGNITVAKMGTLTNAVDSTNLGDDAIAASEIAASAVTIAKFNTTLKTGYIPLDISMVRLVSSNDVAATTEGGVPDGNTAPSYQRVNSSTDKAARLIWASSSSVEVMFAPFSLPPDIDSTAVLTIQIRAAMSGATDTPTVALAYFEGVGDSNAGGNTGAITGTTPATYGFPVVATDVGAAGAAVSVSLTPGTHTTDALHIYGAWVEYTRV